MHATTHLVLRNLHSSTQHSNSQIAELLCPSHDRHTHSRYLNLNFQHIVLDLCRRTTDQTAPIDISCITLLLLLIHKLSEAHTARRGGPFPCRCCCCYCCR